jgi:RNA-directed DNA polymerase
MRRPIGASSQSWANIYLDSLDQFVKRELHCRAYVRYCDDFLLFHDDKAQLHAWKDAVQEHLNTLRLALNWRRSVVYPTRTGIPFLGFRVFHGHRRVRSDNVRLARRRLQHQRDAVMAGRLSRSALRQSLVAWIAHVGHANSYRLRRKILSKIVIRGKKP